MSLRFPLIALLLFPLVMLVAVPAQTRAHGSGLTLTATTTENFVDVDYDSFTIIAGEPGRFDFKLFKDPKRVQPTEFSKVWVRILRESDIKEGDTIFSGWIAKAIFGSTGFSILLPQPGSYKMIVRYNAGDSEIVEATLPFTVEESKTKQSFFDLKFFLGSIVGVALGIAVLLAFKTFIPRRR